MSLKEFRGKSKEELSKLIDDYKAELFLLRFQNATGQLNQSHKIDMVKKDIARILTVINENKEKMVRGTQVKKQAPKVKTTFVKEPAKVVKSTKTVTKTKIKSEEKEAK